MSDNVVYYVVFDDDTNMKEVVETLIEKYGKTKFGQSTISRYSSAGNGWVVGAIKYHAQNNDSINDNYEIHLHNAYEHVSKVVFDTIFSALPNKEYCLSIVKHVEARCNEVKQGDTDHIGTWGIDIYTDADFNPLTLIKVTGDKAIDAIVFDEHRPVIPGGKWYSEGIESSEDKLSSEDISALLRKHRFD